MISRYIEEDIPSIIKLGTEINPNFERLFNIAALPAVERIYVYKDEGRLIAFLHVLLTVDAIEILNIVVAPNSRKQGIAMVLIDYLLSEPLINTGKIILEVRASNEAAINLYKKFDFQVINLRKNYYGDEDAIIMGRSYNS